MIGVFGRKSMKDICKAIAACIMCALLSFGLCACGSSGNHAIPKEEVVSQAGDDLHNLLELSEQYNEDPDAFKAEWDGKAVQLIGVAVDIGPSGRVKCQPSIKIADGATDVYFTSGDLSQFADNTALTFVGIVSAEDGSYCIDNAYLVSNDGEVGL